MVSIAVLAVGLVVWAWSVYLIVTRARRGELITTGPFALVRHPLYTGVSLLVLPWLGFLLDTWLGAAIGIVLYVAARRYSPDEDAELAARFGAAWEDYAASVKLPWL
jgi:protein-S-isoprenylcysteine O-methyltransferase Ste14